jgi:AcrR family transcriptional regulator
MPIPLRTLRAEADALTGHRRKRSTRECEQEDRILLVAGHLFARHGRDNIAFNDFAIAMRMSTRTLRNHFVDLDSLLAEILQRHLRAVADAIGTVPPTALNLHVARRAAYLQATRTPYGGPTEAHILLVRDRHLLPPDLADTIETLRSGLGDMVAFPNGPAALALLDTTEVSASQIETMLAPAAPQPPPDPQKSPLRSQLMAGAALAPLQPALPPLIPDRRTPTHQALTKILSRAGPGT